MDTHDAPNHAPETEATPRWPSLLASVSVGLLSAALPEDLQIGPRWLLLALAGGLAIPAVATFCTGQHHANQKVGYAQNGLLTVALCVSLGLLLAALPAHRETPLQLMQSAGALWLSNVLVFALWYWRLDAGGPHQRDARPGHPDGAFLFPQMSLDGHESWSPEFMDYLFLAFNTSTAFSPTDTAPLSRWAKALMMVQSLVSLLVLAVLAARAVNIL
jgi:hypothetical protein